MVAYVATTLAHLPMKYYIAIKSDANKECKIRYCKAYNVILRIEAGYKII